MRRFTRSLLFLLFFVSGFAGLIDQLVWTRMAFASFGVIAPVLSVLLSVFMLGLAVGSWAGGALAGPLVNATGCSAVLFYGAAECLIGLGAVAVPALFTLGAHALLPTGQIDSARYLLWSALALGLSIFPWCVCMGTTFPFMMAYIRESDPGEAGSFSFLYVANVLGSMAGTALAAVVLVETLGFRQTLWVAAAGNFAIAGTALWMAARRGRTVPVPVPAIVTPAASGTGGSDWLGLTVLFVTGFVSLAMEVVWSRAFAVILKTQVYSFALILFTYLGATCLGSVMYRQELKKGRSRSLAFLFAALAVAALLPVYVNDPRLLEPYVMGTDILPWSAGCLLGSLVPLCAVLGYLTPLLVDRFAGNNPARAGNAYAVNVIGCILGPLVACYVLLPHLSGRDALILLSLPFVALWLAACRSQTIGPRLASAAVLALALGWAMLVSRDYEEHLLTSTNDSVVRRDQIAAVASFGDTRLGKRLLVNGFGMTTLTPVTKFMVHLPMLAHRGPVQSTLVICFGMGTSFRSALSWGGDVTAVELVPSVPKAFGFYHADAEQVLKNPRGHIIIDDGRRYLSRCGRKFDVIVVDPPPPVQSAASSLLFSNEFCQLAREHLNSNGILQMWYPLTNDRIGQALARTLFDTFPYVQCYVSVEGWGKHFLASNEPIEVPTPAAALAAMPAAAVADLTEWSNGIPAQPYLAAVLMRRYRDDYLLNPDPNLQITDDSPYNEYYLLRHFHSWWVSSGKRTSPVLGD